MRDCCAQPDGKVHEEEANLNSAADLRDPHKLLLKSVFKVVDAVEEASGGQAPANEKQYKYEYDNTAFEAHQAGARAHPGGRAGGARGSLFGARASIFSAGIAHHAVSHQQAPGSRQATDHAKVRIDVLVVSWEEFGLTTEIPRNRCYLHRRVRREVCMREESSFVGRLQCRFTKSFLGRSVDVSSIDANRHP